MKRMILLIGCCLILDVTVSAQNIIGPSFKSCPPVKQRPPTLNINATATKLQATASSPCFYKRKSEWQHIIDSTWGPGLPLAQKLNVFDTYSDFVRAHNASFGYTHLNWDSVSAYWRAKINDSTSRGRFSAILSYSSRELHDLHARAADSLVQATALRPASPVIVNVQFDQVGLPSISQFGACLSVLPDSSLLVYKVVPNHPLGLQPGDIVLGYEGIPWKDLIRELLAAEIPLLALEACNPGAENNLYLSCAGMNWHLFDTIDVVKYNTGQTVHLSVDTLATLQPVGGWVNSGQLPISGVPMYTWTRAPYYTPTSPAVSYGIVQGTNIGYIYLSHHSNDNVDALFDDAVWALSKTQGLIIDIRFNFGGWEHVTGGIGRLTSYAGPTLEWLARSSTSDLYSLFPHTYLDLNIPQDNLSYRYPVAVLLNPTCMSFGDWTSHQLTYLDNVRFFGMQPNGAYSGYWDVIAVQPYIPGFELACPVYTVVDTHSPSAQLWGRDFSLDEEVRLTPDNVAKGQDDVVMRALQWIQSQSGAACVYSAALDRQYAQPGKDSVCITSTLFNPLQHTAVLSAIVSDTAGVTRDSIQLCNDGLHGDGAAGDSIWGCRIVAPSDEGMFTVVVRADDITQGTCQRLMYLTPIATCGPLTVSYSTSSGGGPAEKLTEKNALESSSYFYITPYVKNNGKTATIRGASVTLVCDDLFVTSVSPSTIVLPAISPGDSVSPGDYTISYDPSRFLGSFRLRFDVSINGYVLWSYSVKATTGVASQPQLPTVYALHQNYPNPFNPSTTIRFEIPQRSRVRLTIYNILGQQIAELANEEMNAGYFEHTWNANVASGMYFYRIEAVSVTGPGKRFVEVKKMILLK